MAHTLIFNFDEPLTKWACARIPWATYTPSMRAIGVADGPEATDNLLAVCIYMNYMAPTQIDDKTWFGTCEIGFAAQSARWATRRTINNLLSIPFLQYNCRKVVTVIPSTNKRAIRFNEGIGLKLEGTLRHHFAKGVHACIHGMMKSEWQARWNSPRPARPHQDRRHAQGLIVAATSG